MTENLIRIYPCRPEDLDHLSKCASADGHAVIAPTYLIQKGDQTVGYLGIIPSVMVWLDSQRVNMRDSLAVMNFWENQITANGGGVIGVPCTENSPLRPFLPKVQYTDSQCKLFLKNLNR